jgi:glycosyltransferase involved in cell wall biosynthesis
MYNSEGYVLKKKLYSKANEKSIWHKILQKSLRSAYKKMMDNVSYCIYITEYLEGCYQGKYPHKGKSKALYTTTEMRDCSKLGIEDEIFNLVYCGNLGVGRVPALCTVAECLQNVDSNAKLVIYGKFVNKEEENQLCTYKNVEFRGLIPYEEVPKAIARASMVLHCENKERLENLRHAFSTKIADCLACGKPFLVFAAKEYPFVQYLAKNDAAHIAETKEELTGILEGCIKDSKLRSKTINNAVNLAMKNHNADKNAEDFCRIINNL